MRRTFDMSDETAIKVENVSKTFKLPHERHTSLKSSLVNFKSFKKGYEKQVALKNISFEVKKGEFFGVVGRNGSGKSTLLKLLAGIYAPDSGKIHINGKLTPFIELGVGFNPELSGRDNVYLNGALLGFSRKEMDSMYDEIVAFAELERFMDQKLKNYSSGMQVRLAFSIAIRANTSILILDEVLAVGDANFQQKCFDYFEKIKKEQKTIILVTHDMAMVKRFCSRALLIEYGAPKFTGTPEAVANQYTLDNIEAEKGAAKSKNTSLDKTIKSLKVKPCSDLLISNSASFIFDVEYELNEEVPIELGISVLWQGISILEHNTKGLNLSYKKRTKYSVRYTLPLKFINPGRYEVSVAIFKKENFALMGFDANACSFIVDGKPSGGLLTRKGEWSAK